MNIQEYVNKQYGGKPDWFVDEVDSYYHKNRINEILNVKEYLAGKHKILNRQVEEWQGKKYFPRIIILNYAKTILNFSTSYLLSNPITITGNEDAVSKLKRIYKNGKYNRVDFDILDKLQKFGNVFEYPYLDNGVIKSKIIDPADGYAVYSEDDNSYIAFIEHYTINGISYYIVFYHDAVEKYSDEGGSIHLINRWSNISGLPIHYHNLNELDSNFGVSDLDDWVNIIDNMEDLLSKFSDTVYKHHTPLAVSVGSNLTSGGVNSNLIGQGLNLELDSDFKFESPDLNENAVKMLYDTLRQALLDISNVPAVSLNSQDVSNLSEVSIKLLFSLSELRAGLNSKYMREGIEKRFEVFRRILELQGEYINDEDMESVSIVFTTARPMNEKDIIDNLKTLRDIGGISVESMIEQNPLVNDKVVEMERLKEDINIE
jgi:SPP1 family phage portal protein